MCSCHDLLSFYFNRGIYEFSTPYISKSRMKYFTVGIMVSLLVTTNKQSRCSSCLIFIDESKLVYICGGLIRRTMVKRCSASSVLPPSIS